MKPLSETDSVSSSIEFSYWVTDEGSEHIASLKEFSYLVEL